MSPVQQAEQRLGGIRVVVAEDADDLRLGLTRLLTHLGARVRAAPNGKEALALIESEVPDLVLTDLMMPRMSGSDLLMEVKARFPSVQVVIFTGFGTIQTAVTCLRAGAAHFLTKPFDNAEVVQITERLGRQVQAQRNEPRAAAGREFIATDPSMRAALEILERAARTPLPVLIEGESGTGKELAARFLHEHSAAREQRFLAVNATALPDPSLEDELFGHKKGAFSGADKDRDGVFVEVQGGTVFLDEAANMSPAMQARLLRVLQEKQVRPLGSSVDRAVDFRLVTASNSDLEKLVGTGAFREDLFWRLAVLRVRLPALRERPLDIEPLAQHFLHEGARTCLPPHMPTPAFSPAALLALKAHHWPGNVRELSNAVQRALVVCTGQHIHPHHLGLVARAEPAPSLSASAEGDYNAAKQLAIETFQREYVERALENSGGNITHAADRCGMTRAALQRIMSRLGIRGSEG
jgi:DNA-binding NtrC family response regulator